MSSPINNSVIEEYSKNNMCIFTFTGITTYINDKGEEKKKPVGMPNWKDINLQNFKDYCIPNRYGLAILTGELSNISVIDFDNIESYNQMLMDYPELSKYKTIRTKKGVHIYCQYDKNIKTTTQALRNYADVDIRNDNAIVFAPPTKYKLQNGEFCYYTDMGGEILPVPKIIMDNLKQNNEPLQSIKVKVKTLPVKEQADDETDSENSDTEKLSKEQELLRLITIDKKDRVWLKICSCIKNIGLTNDDWLRFCKDNTLNMDEEKINLFKNIKTDYGLEIYFLQSLAKKSNPNGYKKWLSRWSVYSITKPEVIDPYLASLVISKTLKQTLKLCKENWYMLADNQLWQQQKEPSYYIIKEFHKYLDCIREFLNNKISHSDGEQKKNFITQLEEWLQLYTMITKSGYLSVLTKMLRPLLSDNDFENKLDNNVGKLAFKNGIMDLETKIFREGIVWSDFITKTIPYDYIPSDTSNVKKVLKPILNNNDDHLEYYLSIIGYSFIGQPDLEKSIYFMIDKTEGGKGDNGKTFFFDILNDLAPNYVYRTKASLLDTKNTKVHKQLAMTKGIRLLWLEELPREKDTNAELMKEIGDGKKLENEIMFGTSESINIMFKMFALSNHIPKIDPNEQAVYNRYKQVSYNSHFDRTGTRIEADPDNLKFIADTSLSSKIKTQYYNEVFNIIIDYAHKYYERKGLPTIPQQFLNDTKETKYKNDAFGLWFDGNCKVEIGKRIALKFIVNESGMNEKMVKEGMERKGFKYIKDLSKMGKDGFNKAYKGGFEGVEYIEEEVEPEKK